MMGGAIEWRLIPRDEKGSIGPFCAAWNEESGKIKVTLHYAEEKDKKIDGNRAGIEFHPRNRSANLLVPLKNILVLSGRGYGSGKHAKGLTTTLQRRLIIATDVFWQSHDENDHESVKKLFALQDAIVDYECKDWRDLKAKFWDKKQNKECCTPFDPMLIKMMDPMRRRIFPTLLTSGLIYLKDR